MEFNPNQAMGEGANRQADTQNNCLADVCQAEFYKPSSAPSASEAGE